MGDETSSHERYLFGEYELDVTAFELRRAGHPVRLERRPLELLVMMVERPRQLITRAQIVEQLWGSDVFVDPDAAVNTLVWKVRQALRDTRESPAYVETVSGKGYRFVGAVEHRPGRVIEREPIAAPVSAVVAEPLTATVVVPHPEPPTPGRRVFVGVFACLLTALITGWGWLAFSDDAGRVTIAVLPFVNMTGDPEREYLADGLSEEMVASLGQIAPDHLAVIGRTSMMLYKETRKSLADIGRELHVEYLIESSIRAEGSRLRVTSTLVRASDQVQVWSQSYDRDPGSLLGLQRELSTTVAQQIRRQLAPERVTALGRRDTAAPDAYDLYLRGRFYANQRSPQANARAIELLTAATAHDPDYALAWAALAETYAAAPVNGDADPREASRKSIESAERAVQANPELPEAHAALASVHFWFTWDWRAAEAAARKAVALDPGNAGGHRMLAVVTSHLRRFDEARREMAAVVAMDPLDPINQAVASEVEFRARDQRQALVHARQAISLGPEFWIGYMMQGQAEEQVAHADAALEALAAAGRFSNNNSKTLSLRGYLLARNGQHAAAHDIVSTLQTIAQSRYVPPYATALVAAGFNDRDTVFEWLERAYAVHDIHLVFLTVDPKWDAFRDDPRFTSLLARCAFAR